MNDKNKRDIHRSFWIITIMTFVWNVLGTANFVVQMFPGATTSFRATERAIIEGRPIWATIGFAGAVFGGVLGSILILFRKSASLYLFIASFVGVIITMIHTLSAGISFGFGEIAGIIVMPVAVAVYLIWYSARCKKKGWIA